MTSCIITLVPKSDQFNINCTVRIINLDRVHGARDIIILLLYRNDDKN